MIGTIKNHFVGISILLILWFLLSFILPKTQNLILTKNTDKYITDKMNYEAKKLDILNKFEISISKALEDIKDINERNKKAVEWMEHFYNNEFTKIEEFEISIIKQTENFIKRIHFWSIFNPITFYQSCCIELSSCGYSSFLDFYKYVQLKQRQFLRFYIDKRFHEKDFKVKPFLKDDEYIYPLKSSLPQYFGLGILLQFLYIISLFFIGFFFFRRSLAVSTKELNEAGFKGIDIDIKQEFKKVDVKKAEDYTFSVWAEKKKIISDYLFTLFSGYWKKVSGIKGKVILDGVDVTKGKNKTDFIYLCHPDNIPGNIKVKDLFGLYKIDPGDIEQTADKNFYELSGNEKFEVMLPILKNVDKPLVLIDDLDSGILNRSVKLLDVMTELQEKGKMIILVCRTGSDSIEMMKNKEFSLHETWLFDVKGFALSKKNEK